MRSCQSQTPEEYFDDIKRHTVKRVTTKVDLGTLKVLVEAHGSRVGFIHPDDRDIYVGPSW
jgi:hypothetical protein